MDIFKIFFFLYNSNMLELTMDFNPEELTE